MNFNKILVICAHPDDEVLGCGGLLSKLKNKSKIKVLILAEGSSCRFNIKSDIKKINQEIEKRNKYFIQAMNFLKINDYKLYNLKCGMLDTYPIINISKIIEDEINIFKPTTILCHSSEDTNNDHVIINKATIQATRPGALNFVENILSFEILSSTEWNFNSTFKPNYFINLSKKDVNSKIKALKYYKSEIKKYPFPRSEGGIITLSKYRGMQTGVKYAEAFKILRSFKN